MLGSLFNSLRRGLPNLVVAQRVIDKMVSAANHYLEDETGEAMVGLLAAPIREGGLPTLYVLDTISPDESAVRQFATFQQGDERQDEMIWWLQENWHQFREMGKAGKAPGYHAKWDVPLRYLGDWHKQPGAMIQPSGGDLMTALDWLDDESNGMNFLLAPIVTLGHSATSAAQDLKVNYVTIPHAGETMRIDFWYIDRETRLFVPINPAVYPNDLLPATAAYPWHLTDRARAEEETSLLSRDGVFVSLLLWTNGSTLPLDVCFMVARMGSDKVVILSTPYDYPKRAPSARIAPFIPVGEQDDIYDIFEQLWQQSTPLANPPGWAWSEDMRLLNYLHALESSMASSSASSSKGNA